MQLVELLEGASAWADNETTIYVTRPWSCDADAVLVSPAPTSTEPVEHNGKLYDYFLETLIAREVIEELAGSADQRCQRLIEYAENDA